MIKGFLALVKHNASTAILLVYRPHILNPHQEITQSAGFRLVGRNDMVRFLSVRSIGVMTHHNTSLDAKFFHKCPHLPFVRITVLDFHWGNSVSCFMNKVHLKTVAVVKLRLQFPGYPCPWPVGNY